MDLDLILLLVALVFSAFFSGSETAYTVAGRLAMEVFRKHRRPGARIASRLHSNPDLLFSTTLVGNNLVGVLYSSLAAILLDRLGVPLEGIVVISPLLILFFGEVMPKTIAREHAERWAMLVGWPLWLFHILFYPLILLAKGASRLLLALLGERLSGPQLESLSVGDLQGIWGDLHRTGTLNRAEAEMLDHAVNLRELKISDIMTPRADVVALPVGATVAEAENVARSRGYSRLPLYRGDIDNVVGVLSVKDLLTSPERLRDVMRDPVFVPEVASVDRFFFQFRHSKALLAVVVDEHGGTAGVVTLEDLLEELVGDIRDEHDPELHWGRRVSAKAILFSARTPLHVLRQHWQIKIPGGEYETIAGYLLHRLGRIPETGESFQAGEWTLRIVAADGRRIKRVLLRRHSMHSGGH